MMAQTPVMMIGSPAVVADAPSAREDIHYLFENNTDDESGNDYSFTNTSCTYETSTPTPPEGTYTIKSGGAGSYFTLPTSYTDNFPDDFTITFWHYTSVSYYQVMQVEAISMSSGFAIRLNSTDGSEDCDVWTDGTESNATNFSSSSVAGTMFHYAVDYTSSTGLIHIHVNGVNKTDGGSETGDTDIDLTGVWKLLGTSAGEMDDFRIFPEILSTSEILSIKNNPGVPLDDI